MVVRLRLETVGGGGGSSNGGGIKVRYRVDGQRGAEISKAACGGQATVMYQ